MTQGFAPRHQELWLQDGRDREDRPRAVPLPGSLQRRAWKAKAEAC